MEDITFRSKDLEGMSFPHNDALVIPTIIVDSEVKRILVDNKSTSNILSHEAFIQMDISAEQLKLIKTPFGGLVVESSSQEALLGCLSP